MTTWPNRANPWWRALYWFGRGPSEDKFPRSRPALVRAIEGAGLRIAEQEQTNFFVFAGTRRLRVEGPRGNAIDRFAERLLRRLPNRFADLFASSIAILATKA